MTNTRTIISAMNPMMREGDYTAIILTVWFEELDSAVQFLATLFDIERHGKELWLRAMAGEFGPITVIERNVEQPSISDDRT